ncbi:uncharacterized [Tachysurus ichikawai]
MLIEGCSMADMSLENRLDLYSSPLQGSRMKPGETEWVEIYESVAYLVGEKKVVQHKQDHRRTISHSPTPAVRLFDSSRLGDTVVKPNSRIRAAVQRLDCNAHREMEKRQTVET